MNIYKVLAGILAGYILITMLGKWAYIPIIAVALWILIRFIADLYWDYRDRGKW